MVFITARELESAALLPTSQLSQAFIGCPQQFETVPSLTIYTTTNDIGRYTFKMLLRPSKQYEDLFK